MEIWASIDLLNGKVVRLIRGDPSNSIVYSNNPVKTAISFQNSGIHGLHIVDLDNIFNKKSNFEIIKKIVKNVQIPIQVGGGIRNIEYMNKVLEYADRVVLSSIVFENKNIGKELSLNNFDRVVIALDHSNGIIKIKGWKELTNLKLEYIIEKLFNLGFKNFISTNIEHDGTLNGFDESYYKNIKKEIINHVYVAGGIRSIDDLIKIKSLGFKGAIIGRAIYENRISKEELSVL